MHLNKFKKWNIKRCNIKWENKRKEMESIFLNDILYPLKTLLQLIHQLGPHQRGRLSVWPWRKIRNWDLVSGWKLQTSITKCKTLLQAPTKKSFTNSETNCTVETNITQSKTALIGLCARHKKGNKWPKPRYHFCYKPTFCKVVFCKFVLLITNLLVKLFRVLSKCFLKCTFVLEVVSVVVM